MKSSEHSTTARELANEKLIQATQKIQQGMFCVRHNRLCYKRYDGMCAIYTHKNVLEHAWKLVSTVFSLLQTLSKTIFKVLGEPHVTANKVPASMTAKILDYERPGKGTRGGKPFPQAGLSVLQPDVPVLMPPAPVHRQETSFYPSPKRPLDYPAVSDWLKTCKDDLERGRDNHDYMALSPVFAVNGCTRIDDITRLSAITIKTLADEQGVNVTIGLTNRIHAYAVEDVARVRRD